MGSSKVNAKSITSFFSPSRKSKQKSGKSSKTTVASQEIKTIAKDVKIEAEVLSPPQRCGEKENESPAKVLLSPKIAPAKLSPIKTEEETSVDAAKPKALPVLPTEDVT